VPYFWSETPIATLQVVDDEIGFEMKRAVKWHGLWNISFAGSATEGQLPYMTIKV